MDFGTHPLEPSVGPSYVTDPLGSPNNPIMAKSTGNQATAGPFSPGFYPFFCTTHEAFGMVGVIQVLP